MTPSVQIDEPIEIDPTRPEGLDRVKAQLARARGIWRTSETLCRVGVWLGSCLAVLVLACLLDNLFALPSAVRLVLGWGVMLGGLGALFGWALAPLIFWKINDQAAAVYLERRLGTNENLLINAVQLGGHAGKRYSREMIAAVVAEAGERASGLDLRGLWERPRLKKAGLAAGAALIGLLLYALLLPSYASNAMQRLSQPFAGIPPLSQTTVVCLPHGDVTVDDGAHVSVRALAWVGKGRAPDAATLVTDLDGGSRQIPMTRDSDISAELRKEAGAYNADACAAYGYEFSNITKSFSFMVTSGDGQSRTCRILVRQRPAVESAKLELTPPAYTGQPVAQRQMEGGAIHALTGTQAKLTMKATKPLASAQFISPEGNLALSKSADSWSGEFGIRKEGAWKLALTATDNTAAPDAISGTILPQPDALPTVGFESASLNLTAAPGATLPIGLRANDDIGVKTLRIVVAKQEKNDSNAAPQPRELKSWTYRAPGTPGVREVLPLIVDPAQFAMGETYVFIAEATDFCPDGARVARSAPLLVRVLTPGQLDPGANSPNESLFQKIQALIELQTKAKGKTVTVLEFLDDINKQGLLAKRLKSVQDSQTEVNTRAKKVISELAPKDPKASPSEIAKALDLIVAGPMARASKDFDEAQALKDAAALPPVLSRAKAAQDEALAKLAALLGQVAGLDKNKKDEKARADEQDGKRLKDKLEDAKDKIEEFISVQKNIIKATEELEKKAPTDLTDDDKKKLGDLAKSEAEWAKFFKEKFTDMSKIADQDFSNSKLADEFNEVFQEIQKAAEALDKKNTEIAVRAEESGLELAKKLETNLEKWLPTAPDSVKWNMEEPQGKFDVPLADLPKELEDIIGELIDDANKMTDDVEDVSSSWLDSMDKGVGWDAADGPISDMSAKGVTGNQLPNNMEINGRSGEGRSGKSSGQFAEATAEGKGGRPTPTRLTQDPYEAGKVDDKSKDPIGGSTGGGKQSGSAEAGLRGKPPPPTAEKMERLKDSETRLRQQAEKVSVRLQAYNLPNRDMSEAVARMKQIESGLQAGKGFNLRQAHSEVLDRLKSSEQAMHFQAQVNQERARDLPKNVRQAIMSGMKQKAPAGYQDLLEAYYKSLVTPGE